MLAKYYNSENILTETSPIMYLLTQEGEKMRGTIRAKGSCVICNGKFEEIKKLGFICPVHKTTPKRFYIDLFHKGQRIRIFCDKLGQPIDSYQRAYGLLSRINYEIQNYSFEPSKYVRQELEKFYTANLLEKFLDSKINGLAPSYQSDYKRYIRIAQRFFGSRDVRDLKKLDVINYKEHLERDFEFSPKTIKNIFVNFKTFMRYLKDDLEIIDTIPAFPVIETFQPKIQWLTADVQIKAIECVPEEDRPIIAFLMLHGCRPGEGRALKVLDVNLDQETISISATFSNGIYRKKRKGKNAKPVTIPIHSEMMGYIKNRVENNLPEAFLFVNPKTGKHYSEDRLKDIWNDVREKTGLGKSIRLYDATRHSVASQLVNKGVSLFNISKILGHSTTKMTERYSHEDVEKLKIDMKNLSLKKETVTKLSPRAKSLL